jgi:hypothetical protein
MKNILLVLLIGVFSQAYTQNRANVGGLDYRMYFKKGVKSGAYEATVKYQNPNTYTKSTYTLIVVVESNRVTKIRFGNGGSVHTGFNNSGYNYYGGWLEYQYEQYDNVISATTRVTIYKGNSISIYDVSLN